MVREVHILIKLEITGYRLAKVISEYLDSQRATTTVDETFASTSHRVRARTARRWLKKMGFTNCIVRKGVFVDGHERADVVHYRNHIFLPQWEQYKQCLVVFKEDGTWEKPITLLEGEKPLVLITHDESTFNANDGKRRIWMKNGHQPIRPKAHGKGIMVSGFWKATSSNYDIR